MLAIAPLITLLSEVATQAGSAPSSLVNLGYLVAAVLFILGIKGMTHPRTAVRGNLTGAFGMLLAVVITLGFHNFSLRHRSARAVGRAPESDFSLPPRCR